MQFAVEIPGKEPSRIEVYRNPFTGNFRIVADGKVVAQRSVLSPFTHFSVAAVHRYEFSVGRVQPHNVIVEHAVPFLLAGFLPQTFRVFVDGQLIREQRGY